MRCKTKKNVPLFIIIVITYAISFTFFSCNKRNTLLDPKKPTTLTMWHVYGEQVNSPMNDFIEQFNATIGKEKGIIINVTLMSNASQIGKKLKDAQTDKAGSKEMPDLFFCHSSDARGLGANNLLNWSNCFSQSELNNFVPDFLSDGLVDDNLVVFPVSKSTYMLFIAGGVFDRFAVAKDVYYPILEPGKVFSLLPKSITIGQVVNHFAQ